MIDYPTIRLQALDKSTARTITLEAKVGTTIEYGSIFIKIQSCRKSEPLDKPESAAFLQIWEVPINSDKSEWIFSGWMFASSPALSAMDHPVYDVWVLDCINKEKDKADAEALKAAQKAEVEAKKAEKDGAKEAPKPKAVEQDKDINAVINDAIGSDDAPEASAVDEVIEDEPLDNINSQQSLEEDIPYD